MAGSEDWRRQRAIELGLEPYGNSTKRQASSSSNHLVSPSQSLVPTGRDGVAIGDGDGVVAMRSPPPVGAGVDIEKPRETSVRPNTQVYSVSSARQRTVTDVRVKAQRDAVNIAGVAPRGERGVSVYLAGAILAAVAAGGAWFALQQAQPSPTPRPSIRAGKSEPAVALMALPPIAVAKPDAQSVLPAVAAVTCDEPEIVAGLRAAASDQLRRSSLRTGQNWLITVAGISSARSKVADTGGGLTICTAALSLHHASGKAATVDVDYAVQIVAGPRPRVVPLGFNHLVDSITVGALVDPDGAALKRAALPPTATAKKPSRDTALPSRIVVVAKPTLVSTGFLANTTSTGIGLPGATGLSLATSEPNARPEVVKVPRGCDQPATLSVSITCRNASLLALNAEIATAIAALDQPRNERILARIRKRADLRFDRCKSVSCVGNAYRYWLSDLASVTPDQDATMTAGRHDSETSGSTAYSGNDVPRPSGDGSAVRLGPRP